MRKICLTLPIALLLAACDGGGKRDYDSSAACAAQGHTAGTPGFEECVRRERTARMLEQQRNEYEQRKQEEEYWRTRRPY